MDVCENSHKLIKTFELETETLQLNENFLKHPLDKNFFCIAIKYRIRGTRAFYCTKMCEKSKSTTLLYYKKFMMMIMKMQTAGPQNWPSNQNWPSRPPLLQISWIKAQEYIIGALFDCRWNVRKTNPGFWLILVACNLATFSPLCSFFALI